ncbi:MAG: bifunctional diaminohydroxyphosphoribosylaminopyrimidine deaminase/5-amino-6-(5-phosphoribosylamino)uracil reductase RibD [Lentisphaerae bacterium]|nr:bifunctional diaminohydroxyphosphoribosylaminopyrimidine deaminase/5-amino-6-(5-phosphoribosylamino)uracil reductase RibD [Lentisphaerota bacterium]
MDRVDREWLGEALQLARRGAGETWPNPQVGAVIVKDGVKIGEGWHAVAGGPHAEVNAVASCVSSPRGATIYVTLEPCSTQGRTPPCSRLIIESGIRRVVAGCSDPNPRHAGRGYEVLRAAGVEVSDGCREEECKELIAPFAKRLQHGLPYVTLKLAMTLDGKIADRNGRSKWITGPAARDEVQELRRRTDGVMVGGGTIMADDPSLLCRAPRVKQQRLRIIIGGGGCLLRSAQVFSDESGGRVIVCIAEEDLPRLEGELAEVIHKVEILPFAAIQGRISLSEVMKRLADEGLTHILCEGGGALAGGLIEAGLVDECVMFYAPAVMGDNRAVSGVAGTDLLLDEMPRFELVESHEAGSDVVVRVRRR